MQLKSHQQLYVPLLGASMQSLYDESVKEELSHLRIWVTWTTHRCLYMDDNRTYEKVVANEFWIASGRSDLEKRQRTVQLTIFSGGSALPPLLIFSGTGLWINLPGKKQRDREE